MQLKNKFSNHSDDAMHRKSNIKTVQSGAVSYMDGRDLGKSMSLSKKSYPLLLALAVAAIILALIIGLRINSNVVHYDDKMQASFMETVNRGVDQNVPVLADYVNYNDDEMKSKFSDAGINYVDMNEINGTNEYSMDVFSLPSDMTAEDASTAFTNGISKLDSQTAAKLLSGSWRLFITRESDGHFVYNVKYADFKSEGANAAIQAAIEQQGLADSTMGESGTDTNGNTFQDGTTTVDGYDYKWTVSACPLNDVYKVAGIPENAQYVGVKFVY